MSGINKHTWWKNSPKNIVSEDEALRIVRWGIYVNVGVPAYFFAWPLAQNYLPYSEELNRILNIVFFPAQYPSNFPKLMIALGILFAILFQPYRYFRHAVVSLKTNREFRSVYIIGRILTVVDLALFGAYIATLLIPAIFLGIIFFVLPLFLN